MISILLLKHADVSLSAWSLNALAGGVVIQIIRILNARKGNDQMAGVRVKHGQPCRFVGRDE